MRILAWADHALAPTGFGRSARHVLFALHEAGHEITQLAVNADAAAGQPSLPWRVFTPSNVAGDPYGMGDLQKVLSAGRYDAFWTTFDPEIPWFYPIDNAPAIDKIVALRTSNPGFKMAGWFPVDGGPLSDGELATLGMAPYFDVPVTMSPHVYDLIQWTMKLRGRSVDMEQVRQRLRLIPHGVDTEGLTVPTDAERQEARATLGFKPDQFVILQLERNQMRKQNYLAMEVMEQLFARDASLRGKVILYQHMTPDEENQGCRVGWNLPELAWRYGLEPGRDIIWAPGFVVEEHMPKIYRSADVFLSVSTGEGFQYPAWEALACGVPLLVPNDSARAAYFKHAPNAHLYSTFKQRIVLRGGYNRRMNLADPGAAASILKKMIEGKKAFAATPELREAGRSWVKRTANVADVKRQWVQVYAELEEALARDCRATKIAVPGTVAPVSLGWSSPASLGDMLLAAPALRALNDKGPIRLHVPRPMLEIAHIMGAVSELSTEPMPSGATDLASFWAPKLVPAWIDPRQSRVELYGQLLGVVPRPETIQAPESAREVARAQFLERFGAQPADCVVIALEAGSPDRSLPPTYYERIAAEVKRQGFVPLLVGKVPLGLRLLGYIDVTGQLDLPTTVTLLGMVRAFVGVDSGPLHAALIQGTPSVGCFTIIDPNARLGHYTTPWLGVTPNVPEFPAGEGPQDHLRQWPAYPALGKYSSAIDAKTIVEALRRLLEATNQ